MTFGPAHKPQYALTLQADPLRPGGTRFRDPFMQSLPSRALPTGGILVCDPENGYYCIPPGGGFGRHTEDNGSQEESQHEYPLRIV